MKNVSKRIFAIIISALSIIFLVVSFFILQGNKSPDTKPLTLKEAYELSLKEAAKWNSKAALCFMTSVDNPVTENVFEGIDGKRRYWNFEYAVPNTNQHHIITIHDGQVVKSIDTKGLNKNDDLIFSKDIALDSMEALDKAKKEFELKQGVGWAVGYHFVLNKIIDKNVLTVVGLDKYGHFSKINYNASTKELISAIHKIPQFGGAFTGDSKINFSNINEKPFAIMGATVSPSYAKDKTIICWGYYNYSTSKAEPSIKISKDGGRHWKDLDFKIEITQLTFSESFLKDNTIFAATNNGVFLTSNAGESWSEIFKTEDMILDMSVIRKKVAVLTGKALKISDIEDSNWTTVKVPQGTINVGINDNSMYISTIDNIFKRVNDKWESMRTPLKSHILGLQILKDTVICYSSKTIAFMDIKNNKWCEYNARKEIKDIFLDFNFEQRHQLFINYIDGDLFKLRQEGDSIEWIGEKMTRPQGGELVALFSGSNNTQMYFIMPEVEWHDM